jgi:hypothetical protein
MPVALISRNDDGITVKIHVPLKRTLLETEEAILSAVNEAGCLATSEALEHFDSDGSPIVLGSVKYTSKGKLPKTYQTPFGDVVANRHVYQTSSGGKTYVPMEERTRIVITSTPRFAKIISHKYAEMGAPRVVEDFGENHGRKVHRSFVKNVADYVGAIAQAKEESWTYATPELDTSVSAVAVGLDGTMMLQDNEGWREAMVGTVALFDKAGERQHTIYVGAAPEYGKEKFLQRLHREVERVKALYPRSQYVGVADGAEGNWEFLEEHTERQILDFYHATEYLTRAADGKFRKAKEREEWLEARCHDLKHKHGAASRIMNEMDGWMMEGTLSQDGTEGVARSIDYFVNQKHRMKYAQFVEENLPIGSGVTEAACKVIVKQRLCASGMTKWKGEGSAAVISLRCLTYSTGRWQQFWDKIDHYGYSLAA